MQLVHTIPVSLDGYPVFGSTVAVNGPLFDVLGNGNGVVLDLGVPRLRDLI
jgi:hypothetical protein